MFERHLAMVWTASHRTAGNASDVMCNYNISNSAPKRGNGK